MKRTRATPTWDSGETWLATMQHIARESGARGIGCATALKAADSPGDVPFRDGLFSDPDEWINPGDAVIYQPLGGRLAGPMHCEKGLLTADIDMRIVRAARRKFDVLGHDARPDVFTLGVDRSQQSPISFDEAPAHRPDVSSTSSMIGASLFAQSYC